MQYRRELASAWHNLGRLARLRDDSRQAQEAFRQAVRLLQPLAEDYPQVPDYRQNLAIARFQLALQDLAQNPAGPRRNCSACLWIRPA